MQRFLDKLDILGVTLLIVSLALLNYFNFIPLYKALPFLSFLPHKTQIESIPTPTSIPLPAWQRGTQLQREKKIPQSKRILEVNLNYDENASPNLRIVSVNIKNGYSPKYPPQDKGYELQVFDKENKLVSSLTFIEGIPPPLESEERNINPNDIILKKVDFTLTILYVETAKKLQILDPQGKVVATQDLTNVPIIDNKPNFDSIPGANVPEKQNNLLNFIFPQAFAGEFAGEFDRTLDITFIGDGYKNMEQFHTDTDRFKKTLLTYEPFKTRASQILFHKVPNNVNLQCLGLLGDEARNLCNRSLIIQLINDYGAPYDKVYVIINTKRSVGGAIGGKISTMAFGTNSKDGEHGFVHELGHSLGGLYDEHVTTIAAFKKEPKGYTKPGEIGVYQNCVGPDDPNKLGGKEVWPGVSKYYKGCTYSNLYRSSENSIMRDLRTHSFNLVSQRILNEKIDFYAGPFASATPTPTTAVPNIPTSQPTPTPTAILLSPSPTPTPLKPQKAAESPQEKNCTLAIPLPTYSGSTTNKSFLMQAISSPMPYTISADLSIELARKLPNNVYVYDRVLPGTYIFSVRAYVDNTNPYKQYEMLADKITVDAICPTFTTFPIQTSLAPKPTNIPALYPETPTFTPPPPQKREVKSITINGKPVDINNPLLDLLLPGKEGEANKFVIPVIITYSDGEPKEISLVFNYIPTLSPTPTSIRSYTPCVDKCKKFPPEYQKQCNQVCDTPYAQYAQCENQCKLFPTPKPNEPNNLQEACRKVCDELLTPTPLPPTPTPTPTPVGCNCDINQEEWISYGGCGYLGCAANEMPQYRTCDVALSCPFERRCGPDARCPTLTPTPPPIIPGFCSSYKNNIVDCVRDNRCKWTFNDNRCIDK